MCDAPFGARLALVTHVLCTGATLDLWRATVKGRPPNCGARAVACARADGVSTRVTSAGERTRREVAEGWCCGQQSPSLAPCAHQLLRLALPRVSVSALMLAPVPRRSPRYAAFRSLPAALALCAVADDAPHRCPQRSVPGVHAHGHDADTLHTRCSNHPRVTSPSPNRTTSRTPSATSASTARTALPSAHECRCHLVRDHSAQARSCEHDSPRNHADK